MKESIKVISVNDLAVAIAFETEDEIDLKVVTLDEAETLAMELGHYVQDLRMSQYVEETTMGEQP